ncbi:nucleotidyltransferase domain-containing protein [Spirosoma utsteinense]|uniref:Nucleotidyltransferase n=1 Tax=Spirosoma utsteinense TaxID=2585773 RepID=A0ABR6W3I3_9BACT|nr:nucleotidyltransferase domain-containing protein [Spirosoma utsteinense]MBC3784804.1 putative nucleotidyltransferase [Spirosoma utsteinense]MBC3791159.1 putative nucleotidyltransferase [Spirosoma utsteinense]
MTDAQFLQEIKRYVHRVDPQAEVWLFGSRARGDAREDSDWDFLVLTEGPADKHLKNQLRDYLFEIELSSAKVIGSIIHSKQEWEEDYGVTPLYRNIKRDSKLV